MDTADADAEAELDATFAPETDPPEASLTAIRDLLGDHDTESRQEENEDEDSNMGSMGKKRKRELLTFDLFQARLLLCTVRVACINYVHQRLELAALLPNEFCSTRSRFRLSPSLSSIATVVSQSHSLLTDIAPLQLKIMYVIEFYMPCTGHPTQRPTSAPTAHPTLSDWESELCIKNSKDMARPFSCERIQP